MNLKYAIEQVSEQVSIKEKELNNLKKELAWVESASFYYSELTQRQDRWKKISYVSRFVNEVAEDFEFKRTCGCCADAPMEVFPYITFDGRRIYASCGGIIVKKNSHWGEGKWVADWKERLKKSNISDHVIKKVSSMINPEDVEEADPDSNEL